jgi:predicted nucleotidyltransferase
MELNELIRTKRDEILHIARRHGADNIRLFGSAARGEAGPSSDVDLLVEMRPDHSPWFPAGLVADLEELLGKRVHVVTVTALHPYIRERVLQGAVPL